MCCSPVDATACYITDNCSTQHLTQRLYGSLLQQYEEQLHLQSYSFDPLCLKHSLKSMPVTSRASPNARKPPAGKYLKRTLCFIICCMWNRSRVLRAAVDVISIKRLRLVPRDKREIKTNALSHYKK